jgi:hypothetical protein
MHNRVRMVTASFLAKHLLIDWRWGEAYFAQKLLDYDLPPITVAGNGLQALAAMLLPISVYSTQHCKLKGLIRVSSTYANGYQNLMALIM